jgi:hypothetical protein
MNGFNSAARRDMKKAACCGRLDFSGNEDFKAAALISSLRRQF